MAKKRESIKITEELIQEVKKALHNNVSVREINRVLKINNHVFYAIKKILKDRKQDGTENSPKNAAANCEMAAEKTEPVLGQVSVTTNSKPQALNSPSHTKSKPKKQPAPIEILNLSATAEEVLEFNKNLARLENRVKELVAKLNRDNKFDRYKKLKITRSLKQEDTDRIANFVNQITRSNDLGGNIDLIIIVVEQLYNIPIYESRYKLIKELQTRIIELCKKNYQEYWDDMAVNNPLLKK